MVVALLLWKATNDQIGLSLLLLLWSVLGVAHAGLVTPPTRAVG
jgi:hypothetical protein